MATPNFAVAPSDLRLLRSFTVGLLLLGTLVILRPFFVPLCWAAVLVITGWPLNIRLRRLSKRASATVAAAIMTFLMLCAILLAIVPLSLELAKETQRATAGLEELELGGPFRAPEWLSSIPVFGPRLAEVFEQNRDLKAQGLSLLIEHQDSLLQILTSAAREVGIFLFNLGFTVFIAFFFFRSGDVLAVQLEAAARRLGGTHFEELLHSAWNTTLGVMYGVALTALTQGFLAGIGFFFAGAPVPGLLGLSTVVISVIPFGPPMLYVPTAIFLLMNGAPWYAGVGLLLWGVCVVSAVDNVFRPLFISRSTSLSVLTALLGVLGGIISFGLIGIFIGPLVLALTQILWTNFVRKTLPVDPANVGERSSTSNSPSPPDNP